MVLTVLLVSLPIFIDVGCFYSHLGDMTGAGSGGMAYHQQ